MQAVVYTHYGPPEVLQLQEVDKPVPKDHEVLIRIQAATAAAGDWRMRKADPFAARLFNGLLRPTKVNILGFELAGDVETVGQRVTRFKPGDPVFAFAGFGFGAYAEYICLPEIATAVAEKGVVAHKPVNMTYAEAAAVPCGGLTALAFLHKAQVQPGQQVLIYGASGSVGTYAVQLARHMGAAVTAVCSTRNLAWVKALGAEQVMDYTQEDFAQHGPTYDVVFDAVGKRSAASSQRALKPKGRYLSVQGSARLLPDDLHHLKALVEAGHLRAVIDRRYPLARIAEAHRYIEAGHKQGNVVITIGPEN